MSKGTSNLPQSADIGQHFGGGISDFRISGQSLVNRNCYNSRFSNDIDMKLGSATELHKSSTATSKKFADDVVSVNCDVIAIFRALWPIWRDREAQF